jgi:hypothetical protein
MTASAAITLSMSVSQRQLFGGAITMELPTEFHDVSTMRQVYVHAFFCCFPANIKLMQSILLSPYLMYTVVLTIKKSILFHHPITTESYLVHA